MIKLVVMVKKRKDMSQQEFRDYWVNKHSILERKVFARGQIKKIVATFVTDELRGEAPFDGMVQLYFDNLEDFRIERATTGTMMREDEANFCDPDFRIVTMTEEVVIAG